MSILLIITLSRVAIYLFAAYIAYVHRNWWVVILAALAATIATVSYAVDGKLVSGLLSNLFAVLILMVAYHTRPEDK